MNGHGLPAPPLVLCITMARLPLYGHRCTEAYIHITLLATKSLLLGIVESQGWELQSPAQLVTMRKSEGTSK